MLQYLSIMSTLLRIETRILNASSQNGWKAEGTMDHKIWIKSSSNFASLIYLHSLRLWNFDIYALVTTNFPLPFARDLKCTQFFLFILHISEHLITKLSIRAVTFTHTLVLNRNIHWLNQFIFKPQTFNQC